MARLSELEQRLLALKQKMESGLADRAKALRELSHRVEAGDVLARKALKTESHKLRGVAGTYGHQALTDKAAELEQRASLSPPAVVGRMARDLADLAEAASVKASVAQAGAVPAVAAPVAKPPSDRPKAGAAKLRVLAMDDDPLTLRLLSLTLKQVGGFDATIVESANVALELLAKETYDIVISDAMMPEMNGKELCERARAIGVKAPVVILSAASPDELGWSNTLNGATAWLRKPFKPSELVQEIQKIVKQHAKG
jgi:CheY-like chemotaxis protein/HPt (histidine-containing phosphotransfer) domain-containing protein